ncbi:MAG: hypothetical protein CVV34_00555 [Methanomicrobiales archaeon HGW-Methanomicrobiales-5]|nr:MAG: hypothetical protein CVV34_00555 [Methanomicrobiales archaeon HGW-Methanomicrobiales-5]
MLFDNCPEQERAPGSAGTGTFWGVCGTGTGSGHSGTGRSWPYPSPQKPGNWPVSYEEAVCDDGSVHSIILIIILLKIQ